MVTEDTRLLIFIWLIVISWALVVAALVRFIGWGCG